MRLLIMIYFLQNEFKYLPYNINRDDPLISYLYQNKERYNEKVVLIFLFMELLIFICLDALYRLNVNTLTWRWWFQLIVTNQDNYYRCRMKNFELIKLNKSFQIFKHMRSYKICSLLPKFLIQFIANIYSIISIQYNLEHIDINKYLKKKLSILPNLSFRLRLKLINILVMGDRFACWLQLILSMFTLNSYNLTCIMFNKFQVCYCLYFIWYMLNKWILVQFHGTVMYWLIVNFLLLIIWHFSVYSLQFSSLCALPC